MMTKLKEIQRLYLLNRKGLTLIEIVISMALITLILTSFFTVFFQAAKFATNNEDKLNVTNFTRVLANNIEEITIDELINKNILSKNQLKQNFEVILTNQELISSLTKTDLTNNYVTLEFRPGPMSKNDSESSLINVTINTKNQTNGLETSAKTFAYIRWAENDEQ